MKTADFIQALPKAELHLHLEGAIPWSMVQAQALEPLPDKPLWWAEDFRFNDFTDFIITLGFCLTNALTDLETYQYASQAAFKNLTMQNVRYAEISFSAEHAVAMGLELTEVVAAIKSVAPPTLEVRVFCGLNRAQPRPLDDPLLAALFQTSNLDGIDLHGDERLQGPAPFTDIFAKARSLGLMTKAHAGEIVGPQSITEALDHLNVARIEHGATAIKDIALVDRLTEEQITLDLCPTSNLKLRVVDSMEQHPIRSFYDQGIPVTVSTDDPTLFGCSLTGELQLLAQTLAFSPSELAKLQINAFQAAQISTLDRQALVAEIETLVMQLEKMSTKLF